jgi:hypothetical protein
MLHNIAPLIPNGMDEDGCPKHTVILATVTNLRVTVASPHFSHHQVMIDIFG